MNIYYHFVKYIQIKTVRRAVSDWAPFFLFCHIRHVASFLKATWWPSMLAGTLHLTPAFQEQTKERGEGRRRHLEESVPFKEPSRKSHITFLLTFHWPELNHMTTPHDKESGKCLGGSEACQPISIKLLRQEKRRGQLASPTSLSLMTSKMLLLFSF